MTAWTETFVRVGDSTENGVYLEIGPDGEGMGCVNLRTPTPKAIDWWGDIDLNLSPAIARKVADALYIVADYLVAEEAAARTK